MNRAHPWSERAWALLLLACVALYFYGLGSPYAPTNGDEMVYIHIARQTAESGHWLPLVSDIAQLRNTKPPLLFWQAMVAGDWGHHWSLLALRLPSVLYTLATAALLAHLAWRISGQRRTFYLAASVYLLLFCSFRYGRVYLTSAPETFWLGLPLWWLLHQRLRGAGVRGWTSYTLIGLSFGLGCAYKSFALVAPAAATLWLASLLTAPRLDWPVLWRTTLGLAWSTLLAVAFFALWFVLDPDPAAVWQEFVVGENAGKLGSTQGYWHAAWYGPYPMGTQLLAYPVNAGLLFFVVLALGWLGGKRLWRRQTVLPPTLRILLVWLFVWLLVFTIPSQRSERYVIPAVPALAVLLALYWDRLPRWGFWITLGICAPALVIVARVAWVMGTMGIASTTEVALTLIAVTLALAWLTAGFISKNYVRNASLVACLGVYASFTLMVQPLSVPQAGYSPALQQRLAGKTVAVPNGFTGQYERFHFLLPASQLQPYDAEGRNTGALAPDMPPTQRLDFLLTRFDAVVWLQDELAQSTPSCLPHCQLLASRWHVKSRHKAGEVTLENLWYPQQWLFRREWLLAP